MYRLGYKEWHLVWPFQNVRRQRAAQGPCVWVDKRISANMWECFGLRSAVPYLSSSLYHLWDKCVRRHIKPKLAPKGHYTAPVRVHACLIGASGSPGSQLPLIGITVVKETGWRSGPGKSDQSVYVHLKQTQRTTCRVHMSPPGICFNLQR